MILAAIRRTAIKWLLIAATFIALLSAINYGLSFVPFTPQFNAKRAVAKVERLEGEVASLEAAATGNTEIGRAVETYHRETVVYRDLQTQAEIDARSAPNAETPVAAERVARLSDHERRVCIAAGLNCTTIDAARDRAGAVPPDGASGEPDAG